MIHSETHTRHDENIVSQFPLKELFLKDKLFTDWDVSLELIYLIADVKKKKKITSSKYKKNIYGEACLCNPQLIKWETSWFYSSA